MSIKFNGKHTGLFAAGVLFGTAGIKILSSKDAKKVYTQCTAAVLRAKKCVIPAVPNNTPAANNPVCFPLNLIDIMNPPCFLKENVSLWRTEDFPPCCCSFYYPMILARKKRTLQSFFRY